AWDPSAAAMGPEAHTSAADFVDTVADEPPGAPAALRNGDRDRDRPSPLDHADAVDVPRLPRRAPALRLQVRLAQAAPLAAPAMPGEGLEPPRPRGTLGFKPSASTSSATPARSEG